MPMPSKKVIPPEAGFPGLPIKGEDPESVKAWAFMKDEIRPRREFMSDLGENGEWRKVEFGKPGGKQYDVISTSPKDLREFGLGVAMYFETLRLLCVTFFICGLMNAQAITYYKSEMYSDKQEIDPVTGKPVPGMLRGSAVCTRTQLVCLDPDCNAIDSANLCHLTTLQAWLDLTMTIMLLILMWIVTSMQGRISTQIDESIQTAQDYSVIVDDPGPEDGDIELWAAFFGQFGHVTFVTIAKDNGPLLKAMAARRAIMREIIMCIGNGEASKEEDDDGILDTTWDGLSFKEKINQPVSEPKSSKEKRRRFIEKLGAFGMLPMASWVKKLAAANEEIQKAIDTANYKPAKIFITFETERAQRRCLKALSQGILDAAFDTGRDKMDPNHVFKGTNVLNVLEAPEPMEVFYEDVQVNFNLRLKQQSKTLFKTFLMVCVSVVICKFIAVGTGPAIAALWITITNIAVPMVIKNFVLKQEDHVSLNAQQLSLFLKLTFFRWMNTAIVIYLITDFDDFLTVASMKQIQAVLFADAVTTPIIRTLNPADLINQFIICNYAPTQEKMNSYFLGTPWMAAERYADMTKTLFLCLFYSSLFPMGLFITCGGFGFVYMVDKFSLLRSWRTPAELDDDITKVSRGHLVFGIYCHAVMTMIFYAEFPFDNVCLEEDAPQLEWWRYRDARNTYNVSSDLVHTACDQTVSTRVFAVMFGSSLTRDGMYGRQVRVVQAYGLLVSALTFLLFVVFFGRSILLFIYHLHHGKYKSDGDPNEAYFTSCDIQAYIPNITHPALAYPLVACNVDSFDVKYLPFEMPEKSMYYVQSLYNKMELPGFTKEELDALFSEVKYFPPPDDIRDTEKKKADEETAKAAQGKGGYEKVPTE